MFPPLKVGDKNLDLETSDMGVYTESWEEMIQFLLMSIFFEMGGSLRRVTDDPSTPH